MKRLPLTLVIIIILLQACKSQPDYIIQEDAMVDLLVDVHKTEAVISLNYTSYNTDEKKSIMREAVYMRHNTTKAQFDTSLVWYGNNLEVYMDIYDKVIARLEQENDDIKELIAQEDVQTLTAEGDTVDIWKLQPWHVFECNKGSNILAFNIDRDENFRRQDLFRLRLHVINAPLGGESPLVYLATRHTNNIIHYNTSLISKDGWTSIEVMSDSLYDINDLYGYISMAPDKYRHIMYIDSIELMRIHHKKGMPKCNYNIMDTQPKEKTSKQNLRPSPTKFHKMDLGNR